MILSPSRSFRNWRSKKALKQCIAASHEALARADAALSEAGIQVSSFIEEIKAAAEDTPHDGPTLRQARAVLRSRSQQLTLQIQQKIGNLSTALLGKRCRSDRFTVALFGETQAGKSTIREAIMEGDGSTIGKGGQRTTREIREYIWQGLSIIDTPGFAAYEGEEDQKLAFSIVDESDAIVFMLTSNGIQEETFREIVALNRLRKNVVFVMNVKLDLTGIAKYRRDFIREPKARLGAAAIQPHRHRIESLAKKHADWMVSDIRLIAVHAQAAHIARLPEYRSDSRALLAASNIKELLHHLEDELHTRGPQRRIQTIIGGTERALTFIAHDLAVVGEDFQKELEILEEKHLELSKSLADFVARFPTRCRDDVTEHFAPVLGGLGTFVEENLRKKDFKDLWKAKLGKLKTEEWGKDFATQIAAEVSAKVAEFWRQYQQDSEFFHQQEAKGVESADPTDWRKMVRWVGIGIGAIATVAFLISPVGWVAELSVGAAAATIGLSSLLFPEIERKRSQAREEAALKLQAEVATLSGNLEKSIGDWFSKEIEQRLILLLHHDVNRMCKSIFQLSSKSNTLSASLNSSRLNLVSHYPEHFSSPSESETSAS